MISLLLILVVCILRGTVSLILLSRLALPCALHWNAD